MAESISRFKPYGKFVGCTDTIVHREGRQLNSVNALRKAIIDAWTEISLEVLQNLSISMNDKIFKCILAKGANTKN